MVTQPDRRRGRGGATSPTPVAREAEALGLPVSHTTADAAAAGAELGIVVAYGRIVRPEVLALLPMVNVHFSLLPRWRGAAPVERAVLAGDATTGVCLMEVEEGLDTGGVYRRMETPIGASETARELTDRLAALGAEMLVAALDEGLGEPVAQAGEVTYAHKIDPAELEIDWSAGQNGVQRLVRIGRAWTTWRGTRLLVQSVSATDGPGQGSSPAASPGALEGPMVWAGDGWLELVRVQPEGRRPQGGGEWARGARPVQGERLGAKP